MDLMRVVMDELFARSAEQTTHNKTVGDNDSESDTATRVAEVGHPG